MANNNVNKNNVNVPFDSDEEEAVSDRDGSFYDTDDDDVFDSMIESSKGRRSKISSSYRDLARHRWIAGACEYRCRICDAKILSVPVIFNFFVCLP